MTLQTGPLRWVVRKGCLDDAAALVARRSKDLLQQRIGNAVCVVVGIDHDEVHGADEATGPDGWAKGEHRASDHFAPGFGNEDAGLREIDQLSEQVSRIHRSRSPGRANRPAAERDEPFDVRDASRADQVFHAGEGTSCSRREQWNSRPSPSGSRSDRTVVDGTSREGEPEGSTAHARVAPTVVAFGPLASMIRHRFGGNLRAARTPSHCDAAGRISASRSRRIAPRRVRHRLVLEVWATAAIVCQIPVGSPVSLTDVDRPRSARSRRRDT